MEIYLDEFTYEGLLPFPIYDDCLGAVHTRPTLLKTYDNKTQEDTEYEGNTLITSVLAEPIIFKAMMTNHKYAISDDVFHNECGHSIYNLKWVPLSEKTNPEQIFQRLNLTDEADNNEFDPPTYLLKTTNSFEAGTYGIKIEVRDSLINIPEIVDTFDFTIVVNPCFTERVWIESDPFKPILLYQQTKLPTKVSLPEFHQFPSCNYTWTYTILELNNTVKEDGTRDKMASLEILNSYPKVESSILVNFNFEKDDNWLELQEFNTTTHGNLYDIFVAGELGFSGDDDPDSAQQKLFLATDPIIVEISMPYYLLYNSLPPFPFMGDRQVDLLPGEDHLV